MGEFNEIGQVEKEHLTCFNLDLIFPKKKTDSMESMNRFALLKNDHD